MLAGGSVAAAITPPTRVVVFHAPGAPPAKPLIDALDRRSRVDRRVVAHPWAALSGVLSPGAAHCVLVLHEPGSLPDVPTLLEALAKYASKTKVWIFDAVATPPLRAATDSDLALLRLRRPAAATPAAAAASFIADSPAPDLRTAPAATPAPPPLKLAGGEPGVNTWILSAPTSAPTANTFQTPNQELTQTPPIAQPAPQPLLSAEELAMLLSDDPSNRT